jgi:hypothetical protein
MPHLADAPGAASTFPLNESFRAKGVPDKFSPMSWPHSVPPDLRRSLEAVLGQRSHGAAELWGEVRDWLEAHGVAVPESLKLEQPAETAQRDQ